MARVDTGRGRRWRAILLGALTLALASIWFVTSSRNPPSRHQLAFALVGIQESNAAGRNLPRDRELVGWEIYPGGGRTNSAALPPVATLRLRNAGTTPVEVFPLFSVETRVEHADPAYEAPRNLRRLLQPGESCDTQIILRGVGSHPWRVGVWHDEVSAPWAKRLRPWLVRLGLCADKGKILEYSDWFEPTLGRSNKLER